MSLASQRRMARHYAMQALYQWVMTGEYVREINIQFRDEYDFEKVDGEYFDVLLSGVTSQAGDIDEALAEFLDRDKKDLGGVELALLRIGTYEMKERIDVPFKVVINEAVSLARKFGATDSHKYINGVLDKMAKKYRDEELKAVK